MTENPVTRSPRDFRWPWFGGVTLVVAILVADGNARSVLAGGRRFGSGRPRCVSWTGQCGRCGDARMSCSRDRTGRYWLLSRLWWL